ncbi:MAG: hypothetical protein AB1592_13360 [Pseudomonadota bacterium]
MPLADVCRVLEIANSRDAAARPDDDEKADVGITGTSSNGVAHSLWRVHWSRMAICVPEAVQM